MTAINTYALPALSYGFVVLDWSITDLNIIDRETRNILKKNHAIQNASNTLRLYIPRKNGGRGLLNVTQQYKKSIINMKYYLRNTEQRILKLAANYDLERASKSIQHKADKYCTELNIDYVDLSSKEKTVFKNNIKNRFIEHNINTLKTMNMHGQYQRELEQPYIDFNLSTTWLSDSRLKRHTESIIMAIQEQAVTTRYIERHLHHTTNNSTCRNCNQYDETIQHIISGCPMFSTTIYLQRHNNLAKYIYIQLANKFSIPVTQQWYQCEPEKIIENNAAKILWDFSVQTDKTIPHNKPDILLVDKDERKAYVIDIACPSDYNVVKKRREKINHYTDLAIEIKSMWQLDNVVIVPIIIGATGLIHKQFLNDTNKLDVKLNISEMQKAVLLGTSYIVRRFFTQNSL